MDSVLTTRKMFFKNLIRCQLSRTGQEIFSVFRVGIELNSLESHIFLSSFLVFFSRLVRNSLASIFGGIVLLGGLVGTSWLLNWMSTPTVLGRPLPSAAN